MASKVGEGVASLSLHDHDAVTASRSYGGVNTEGSVATEADRDGSEDEETQEGQNGDTKGAEATSKSSNHAQPPALQQRASLTIDCQPRRRRRKSRRRRRNLASSQPSRRLHLAYLYRTCSLTATTQRVRFKSTMTRTGIAPLRRRKGILTV